MVGAGGLLGSAVCRRLRDAGPRGADHPVPWGDHEASVAALLRDAAELPVRWEVYWCAGAGVVGSSTEELDAEVAVLADFLGRWEPVTGAGGVRVLPGLVGRRRVRRCDGPPFTEHTEPAPISPYGRAKLRSEEMATDFAVRTGTALLVGRLANLYGPGQDMGKPQGLVSQLCRAQLTRQPLSVYVSLDTMRDYLFVDDAAAMVVAGLDAVTDAGRTGAEGAGQRAIDDHRRRARRPAPDHPASTARRARHLGQCPLPGRDLRLRSVAWPRTSCAGAYPDGGRHRGDPHLDAPPAEGARVA